MKTLPHVATWGCLRAVEQHRWPPMRNYQIAQETDAQNGATAEGCVKGLLQSSTPISDPRLGRFPLRRATGKFDALVLVEGFCYVRGWLAGRSGAGIGYYPIARRTSPSSETAIFKPDQLSTSHVSGPEELPTRHGSGNYQPTQRSQLPVAAEYRVSARLVPG
jgi:hypothetical protein